MGLITRVAFLSAVVVLLVVGAFVPATAHVHFPPRQLEMLVWIIYGVCAVELLVAHSLVLRKLRNSGQPTLVIRMAFYESMAIYGLVLRVLGADAIHQYVLSGVAASLIVVSFVLGPAEA